MQMIQEINEKYLTYTTSYQEIIDTFHISKAQKRYIKVDESKKQIHFQYPNKSIESSFEQVEILYEDETLIIANKPPFLLVHSDGNEKDTLQARVNGYLQMNGYTLWAQAIHRIDYETSGLVLFCKHPFFQAYYDDLMQTHTIKKEYIAIVQGNTNYKHKIVRTNLSRDRHNAKKMIAHPQGKECISIFHTIQNFSNYSLIKVEIKTGRKHQIRVQCKSLNHPIVNDPLYGKVMNADGLYLQSHKIKILDKDFKIEHESRFQNFIKLHT